jgi:hydrogenase nickel incorporation protein HypA/HybF
VSTPVFHAPKDKEFLRKEVPNLHELSLVASICDVLQTKIKEYGISKVTAVKLIVGELTGVEAFMLESCFDMYVEGSPLEGAKLIIEPQPIKLRCLRCGNEYESKIPFSDCAVCGNKSISIISGKEFYIDSIEANQ